MVVTMLSGLFLAIFAASASVSDAIAVSLQHGSSSGGSRAASIRSHQGEGEGEAMELNPEDRINFAKHGNDWKLGDCASRSMQSPITINELYTPATGGFSYRYRDFAGENFTLSNNGRSLFADFAGKNVGYVSLPHADAAQYELSKVEFHSPSEHTLRGKHLPLEVQLVHQPPNGHPGRQLVTVSILVNCSSDLLSTMEQAWPALIQSQTHLRARHKDGVAKKLNASGSVEAEIAAAAAVAAAPLKAFVRSDLPALKESKLVDVPKAAPMQLGDFLANGTYAMYRGSQTLPPCSEKVVWLVRRDPIVAPTKELKLLFDRLLESTGAHGNFRTVMPLNQRPIEFWTASEYQPPTSAGSSSDGIASNADLESQAKDAIAIAMAASDYAKGLSNRISEGAIAGEKAFQATPSTYGLVEAARSTTKAPPPTGPEGDIWAAQQIGNFVKEAISKSVTQSLQEVIPATSELAASYMKQALAKAEAAAKKQAPTLVPLAVPVTFSVLVLNIHYAMLVANPLLEAKFSSTAIAAATTVIGNGITSNDISATLAAGSVRIDFLIQVPVQLNAGAVQDRIAAGAGELGAYVTRALAALPDLISISTGSSPEVAEVGPPVILPPPPQVGWAA